ncbi:MAG: tyrosine-type recombinase/integrase [Armatimonadetes bacterium]|nr:tyrosine-type recombinase/integrase [Armatimonadota bacterium]
MSTVYRPVPTPAKRQEIEETLAGYWEKDRWVITDPIFDEFRPERWPSYNKTIDFSRLQPGIKEEVKFFFVCRLREHTLRLITATVNYGNRLTRLSDFLKRAYPEIVSFADLEIEKAMTRWRSYLVERGLSVNKEGCLSNNHYEDLLRQVYQFMVNFYDDREEFEKNVWDARKIPGAKYTQNKANYLLSFEDIPISFRPLAKKYLKVQVGMRSQGQCATDLMALRLFFRFIHKQYPDWKDLKRLSRKDMENYLSWYRSYTEGWQKRHYDYLVYLRSFFDYIQRAGYPEAPEKPHFSLLFKEDFPRLAKRSEEDIKFIPEGVLRQLEENLDQLTPPEYIPVVVLLRATGWRISDILNLRYDNCLDRTAQGWWLCGDILKTRVLNHRVPITDEAAVIVQAVIDEVREKSIPENNPNKLLFARLEGKRKGRPPMGLLIQRALNRLAIKCNIVDDQGRVFHFGNHAFRHTKGVELINNGMNLVHVQKWMAHASPEMTLRYARILDSTMRKSWEEATKNGLFRIDSTGKPVKIDPSDIKNEDLIEWEYIRYNLDAVRTPLGYCLKPHKVECKHQLNPCLTCRNLCTTPDFIPQFEAEIREVKAVIERGKAQGRTIWVEKNEALLERYEAILTVLKEGHTHHLAGKKGREYVGEERLNVRQTPA